MKALIFDCDGVLADTERDGHRVAFNRAFAALGLAVEWDVTLYGELLKVGGGKERAKFFFDRHGWPAAATDRDAFLAELHKKKTALFMEIIESGALPLRPGIARIVGEAMAAGVALAVASTSNERSVNAVLNQLGSGKRKGFAKVLAGDIVARKKPDPAIYLLALSELGLRPDEALVVEDSRNGLLAARGAGLRCLVTTNPYTVDEDFTGAARVVPELGDPPAAHLTLGDLRALLA